MFDPKIFAKNLKASAISEADKEAILNLLPHLSIEAMEEIDLALKQEQVKQELLLEELILKASMMKNEVMKEEEK